MFKSIFQRQLIVLLLTLLSLSSVWAASASLPDSHCESQMAIAASDMVMHGASMEGHDHSAMVQAAMEPASNVDCCDQCNDCPMSYCSASVALPANNNNGKALQSSTFLLTENVSLHSLFSTPDRRPPKAA